MIEKQQMNDLNENNEFMGYSLFFDVEDNVLRIRNRGVTIINMTEDLTNQGYDENDVAKNVIEYMKYFSVDEWEAIYFVAEQCFEKRKKAYHYA